MKEFLIYFFSWGSEPEFALFTPAHFAPILFMLAVIFLTRRFKNQLRESKFEVNIRYILAFLLVISDMAYYWRVAGHPGMTPDPTQHLPISVCGWAAIFCSFMLVGKSQTLFDISYFWILSGSVFALLTPTPLTYTGPTRFRYYQFWGEHTMIFIAVFYMIFVHGMRPTVKSALKSYAALWGLTAIAIWVNDLVGEGANYLFMARPEAAPSVLDILPPNFILRTAIIIAVITTLFVAAYIPWYVKDRKAAAIQNR